MTSTEAKRLFFWSFGTLIAAFGAAFTWGFPSFWLVVGLCVVALAIGEKT